MKPQTQSTTVPALVGKALTVAVVLLSFWFVWQQIQESEIDVVDTLFNSKPVILLSVLCIFGVIALSPIVWKFLMLGCGTDVPYRMCFAIWWTTNIAKYVPGKVSLIAGRVYIARNYGKGVVLESFAWELIISLSSAVLAGLFLLDLDGISTTTKAALLSVAIASLFPVMSPKLTQRVVRKPFALLGRGNWDEETSMTRRIYSITLMLMMVSWILWGLGHKFILLGLGIEASLLHLIGAFSLAWLIGFSAFFLPAGLGAREGVFTLNLTLFIGGGVAGILVILSRVINILVEVVAFGIGLLMFSKEDIEEE
ncbi:MAG: lysylphosphatidylglycerol synthase domain-containing protein [Poseidonia sp.]